MAQGRLDDYMSIPAGVNEVGDADPEFSPPPAGFSAPQTQYIARGRRAIGILSSFFLGQGALQGIQLLVGLFLVRKLSVEAYAQYGLAIAFQMTMITLMDLGFSTTIIPLVGERREDPSLVGRYVRSAKHLRDRLFWILAPIAMIAFLAIMHNRHWGWGVQIALLLSVLLTLHSSGRLSYYSAPFFLFGRLREFYTPQTLSGLVRLIAYIGFGIAGVLNAWTAAGLNAINVTINGTLLQKRASQYMVWPHEDDLSTDREVFRYILPATPAIIFAAFQAQISLFLISIFGKTANIAEVAALSRLGQIFTMFMTFNAVVVEPYVARLKRERLMPTYVVFVGLAILLSVPIVLFSFEVPGPFLWLLGSHYKGLGGSVGWVILTSCITYVAGLMWMMNRARRWVFWRGTILEIVLVLAVQIGFIVLVGIRTTEDAVLFAFASSICYLAGHAYIGIYGFRAGKREC